MLAEGKDIYDGIDFKLYYDIRGNAFDLWVMYARVLKRSADILWSTNIEAMLRDIWHTRKRYDSEEEQLAYVYMMLMGMALENLFKAIYVQEKNILAKDGVMKKPWKNGHDLEELAELVKWKPASKWDAELIRDLAKYIEQGRYPIMKRFNFENFPKGSVTPITKQSIDRIFNELMAKIIPEENP